MENPPAFPRDERYLGHNGMTLRDYFAAQAMAAIIGKISFQEFPADWSPYEKAAIGAYDYADAMLAARETAPAVEPQMQHVGYYDEDGFDWMTGIKPRNCELYAAPTQEPTPC